MRRLAMRRAKMPSGASLAGQAPPLLRLQDRPPNPLGQRVLWVLLAFLAALLLWAIFGQLDIVAVAEGKLIPQSYVKIVQPAEAGIVKRILVREGESVHAGQVLMQMDTLIAEADTRSLAADAARKRLSIRRIDAELAGQPFKSEASDPPDLVREIEAQYRANRVALSAALAEERARLSKAQQELAAAKQVKQKLEAILPHYRAQDKAFEKLSENGFAGSIMTSDKRRERIEKEQELETQEHLIGSAEASIGQSRKRQAQIEADTRQKLYVEKNDLTGQLDKLTQEIAKQAHRQALMALQAPQDGTVKDLATHTAGTVVQPGAIMLTLVPKGDPLRAEVWISNEDIGFVRPGQEVKLKFAPYPFQKYGMGYGKVETVSADAADQNTQGNSTAPTTDSTGKPQPLRYKALIVLQAMHLTAAGECFPLSVGMQTNAEILLGTRSVLAYLLSPVQKAWHEAGRER
jgi:hemolysin D